MKQNNGQAGTEADVVNVTFQLKGANATEFREYMRREHIDLNSVAGKKLAIERLEQLKPAPVRAGR